MISKSQFRDYHAAAGIDSAFSHDFARNWAHPKLVTTYGKNVWQGVLSTVVAVSP